MCLLPWSSLWSCCCEKRTIREGSGKKRHRNTRVRIASNHPSGRTSSTRVDGTKSHRRRSASNTASTERRHPHRRRTSRSAEGAARSSSRHRSSRTLDGQDLDREEKKRRRRSSSGVGATDGRAAAERALSGGGAALVASEVATTATTATRESKSRHHRRPKSSGRDEHTERYLISEKRHRRRSSGGHSGVHDDSGYKTEEKRRSSRRSATDRISTATEFDYSPRSMDGKAVPAKRSVTDFDYNPKPMSGHGQEKESPTRGILRKAGHHSKGESSSGMVVNMLQHDAEHVSRADEHEFKTTREVKKPSRSKSTGNRDREHRSKGESSSRAAVIAADATRTQQTSRATRQMSTSMTGGDILPRRSTRKKAIRAEDVDMSYRDPDADDDDDPDEEYVASDDTYVDGPQKLTRSQSQRIRRPRTAVNPGLMRSKSAKETSSSSTTRKRTTTQRKQKATSGIRTANDTTITRAEAQYADPRSQHTEFSLGNLEQLAAEGLQRRPTLPRSSAFPSSSSAPPPKPSFSYREEGPLPKTDAEHHASLTEHIGAKNLTSILPLSSPLIRRVATSAASMAAGVARSLYLSPYATPDLTKLGLYDVIVFCDDSTSMQKEERWATLKTVVRRIARISSAYNPQGIKIRFINSSNDTGFNGVVTEEQVETCLDAVTMARGTMIGTRLFEKVVLREIVEKAKRGELTKPVVVSVVTDGEPSGEHTDTLKRTILATKNELSKLPTPSGGKYGSSAVVFQIARVGTSAAAKRYVSSLQHDKDLKGLVYCTDESLDWAMGEAENNSQMNTWLTQVLAGSIKA